MACRFKFRSCVLSVIFIILAGQVIVLLYLKMNRQKTTDDVIRESPNDIGHPMIPEMLKPHGKVLNNGRNYDEAQDVNTVKPHAKSQDEIQIIKSPLGYDKLHTDDGSLHKNIVRQKVFGFSTSAPLVVNISIFDKMAEQGECIGSSKSNRSLSSGIFCLPQVPPTKTTDDRSGQMYGGDN